ncbi:MAG: sigma-54 dependent transcriptional regulator [Syntrophobacterales bacterium]|jgi:DNA-binding NtrC family response regulator|nr:sigma-54 dependent transcriptional regulator [Syntrophobacterales bacterium]
MIRVLIIDDETRLVEAFREQLTEQKMKVLTAFRASEALSILKDETVDVVILDIKLPDMDGVELLMKLKHSEPTLEVIILTGFASVATAIRSMKLGAYDYLTKPCKMSELSKVIAKAYEKKMLMVKNIVLEEQLHRIRVRDRFVGTSDEMARVEHMISLVALSAAPVLILGETGTGKELAARAIHDLSPRSGNPFVTINSSALQETMLESELFGYRKGAFTGADSDKLGLLEIANHGTFFVDEVGEMSLNIQAKLLRALETGAFRKLGDTKETRVDVRFIFATNKQLKREVDEGRFRKDLFFRINTLLLNLPPLRKKREDIPFLVDYFLDKFSRPGKKKRFSAEAMRLLMAYEWPGNVRELANVVERSVLISTHREEMFADDLTEGILSGTSQVEDAARMSQGEKILSLASMEAQYIQKVLNYVGNNKSQAARLLGISRKALYDKIGSKSEEEDPAGR